LAFAAPTFMEFVIRDREDRVDDLVSQGLDNGYMVGVPLGQFDPGLADCLLVAVTEKRTRAELDRLVELLNQTESQENKFLKDPHFATAAAQV